MAGRPVDDPQGRLRVRDTGHTLLRWLLAGVGLLAVAVGALLIGAVAAQFVFAVAGA